MFVFGKRLSGVAVKELKKNILIYCQNYVEFKISSHVSVFFKFVLEKIIILFGTFARRKTYSLMMIIIDHKIAFMQILHDTHNDDLGTILGTV